MHLLEARMHRRYIKTHTPLNGLPNVIETPMAQTAEPVSDGRGRPSRP
jgi:hypothetical protein